MCIYRSAGKATSVRKSGATTSQVLFDFINWKFANCFMLASQHALGAIKKRKAKTFQTKTTWNEGRKTFRSGYWWHKSRLTITLINFFFSFLSLYIFFSFFKENFAALLCSAVFLDWSQRRLNVTKWQSPSRIQLFFSPSHKTTNFRI